MTLPSVVPPILDLMVVLKAWILLEGVENADFYFACAALLLTVTLLIQLSVFSRHPPVPSKVLPRRPGLQILFKPEDVSPFAACAASSSASVAGSSSYVGSPPPPVPTVVDSIGSSIPTSAHVIDGTEDAAFSIDGHDQDYVETGEPGEPHSSSSVGGGSTRAARAAFTRRASDLLPDSFAPLLSSSHTEVVLNELTPELIHGFACDGNIRLGNGSHTIHLTKDPTRPKLTLDVQEKTAINVKVEVGSYGFSSQEDFDMKRPTRSRSLAMVKDLCISLESPIALLNVSPTLIHLPSLFEDNAIPVLRRIRGVDLALKVLASFSKFVERCLWLIESKCKIHLSKIRVTPMFRGGNLHANWRLRISFSGHVLLFGWIPIPFFSVTLPTFIIPAPHAFLRNLLTPQPLASAKLNRENIPHEKLMLSILESVESWNMDMKLLATPPALSVDVTLPGGMTVAVETMLGRDEMPSSSANSSSAPHDASSHPLYVNDTFDAQSMSSWNSGPDSVINNNTSNNQRYRRNSVTQKKKPFDANTVMPWVAETSLNGTISNDKVSINVSRVSAAQYGGGSYSLDEKKSSVDNGSTSQVTASGSFVVWRVDPANIPANRYASTNNMLLPQRKRNLSTSSLPEFSANAAEDAMLPAVYSTLLFPGFVQSTTKNQRVRQLMQYDYSFDVEEDTNLEAVSISVGVTHPMLKGSTIITTVLESIYACGSLTAREGSSILDPFSRARKRNFLRHLPATDFTLGVQNAFIPEQSMSYHDDGQTRCIPMLRSGRLKIHVTGGLNEDTSPTWKATSAEESGSLEVDGLKVVANFSLGSFRMENETNVREFPELDIFEGSKLISLISGTCSGSIFCHLRPQAVGLANKTHRRPGDFHEQSSHYPTSTGRNVFNPLEAYEIDFAGSSVSVRIKEWTESLGHRRLIIPSETTFFLRVLRSVVDMSFEGMTQCECSWDFQGLSPMLQVTYDGTSPADATHENKDQVPLLIADLRQGRLNFNVSPVGGITITQAVTARENRDGLYDWKFFNAIVSPDEESAARIMKVLHDKRTMGKFIQVVGLVSNELRRILSYILTQVWRAKEILDQEGVTDPGHAVPGHKMARLVSLFLCGDLSRVEDLIPIIRRVTAGNGLDVVKVKELLREHLSAYDDWTPEIDHVVRWLAVLFGPMTTQAPYVESNVLPLSQLPHYAQRFSSIPSAKELYNAVNHELHLPLDVEFSNLLGRVAPYMSFHQVEYILRTRSRPHDWQPDDLRRLRYVYSVKKKVQDISESYGGLSFLPQSFFVSVFLGEATRASLRARTPEPISGRSRQSLVSWSNKMNNKPQKVSTLSTLRRRRRAFDRSGTTANTEPHNLGSFVSPAGRVASQYNLQSFQHTDTHNISSRGGSSRHIRQSPAEAVSIPTDDSLQPYELGDCLLGPEDVAILLQAGLTSAMKRSTVVQLNQRMLLDLIASQPRSFAVAVLAEIGQPGGHGSARGLASALMALLELDQSSFVEEHRLDVHRLLETWLPGFKMPRREDYLAGGRWARQSYYEAVSAVAKNILEDAESYMALKGHIQRVRHNKESDSLPVPKEIDLHNGVNGTGEKQAPAMEGVSCSKFSKAVACAKDKIFLADKQGSGVLEQLRERKCDSKSCEQAICSYSEAFAACSEVLRMDKLAFQLDWFKKFYGRNYEALMVLSLYENVINDVDKVRSWLEELRSAKRNQSGHQQTENSKTINQADASKEVSQFSETARRDVMKQTESTARHSQLEQDPPNSKRFFSSVDQHHEQEIVDTIIDCVYFDENERERIRKDPLVRLLISNPAGNYNFTVVLAMGVITEGVHGLELAAALDRLKQLRGVESIRSDTGVARSFEFNASRIEDAIKTAVRFKRPFGFLGYSQGCANCLMSESLFLSGTPIQQEILKSSEVGLVCRNLLFSAANGSIHGPAMDTKIQRLIVMCEQAFKYQQGYFSRAFTSATLETLNSIMDSAAFHKIVGGAHTFLPEGSRAFWREAQHLPHVPTTTLRGVLEDHTTPECLEMVSNMLTKQSGSALHDSQVHVYDAVGHPVYTKNRNGLILAASDMGGAIQRTHHWSPLDKEVEFVRTQRDLERASFDCAKDRHVFPWVDVNVRFGIIKYRSGSSSEDSEKKKSTKS